MEDAHGKPWGLRFDSSQGLDWSTSNEGFCDSCDRGDIVRGEDIERKKHRPGRLRFSARTQRREHTNMVAIGLITWWRRFKSFNRHCLQNCRFEKRCSRNSCGL
jgi:hypothetical protein